jgi:hypothetical protein
VSRPEFVHVGQLWSIDHVLPFAESLQKTKEKINCQLTSMLREIAKEKAEECQKLLRLPD